MMNERERPTHLDLFSGIGGFSLAFEAAGFKTIGFAEIDTAASKVLAHWWPDIRNYGDITRAGLFATLCGVDVITGGVPCQPASAIGQMRGTDDERWLWPDAIRVVGEIRPRFAVFENPPSLLNLESGRAFNGIVSGLAALGYDLLWDVVPAAAIGAGHLRERLYIIASDSTRVIKGEPTDSINAFADGRHAWAQPVSNGCFPASADAVREGLERHTRNAASVGIAVTGRPIAPPDLRYVVSGHDWWRETVTGIPVLAYGLSGKLVESYCRCAGNAIVPQVAYIFAKAIYNLITDNP